MSAHPIQLVIFGATGDLTLRKLMPALTTLAEKGLPIEEGTLYPLLRRLEAQGLLKSEWRIEDGPPRRYYSLNADGRKLFKRLTESWQGLNEAMDRLLKGDGR